MNQKTDQFIQKIMDGLIDYENNLELQLWSVYMIGFNSTERFSSPLVTTDYNWSN